MKQIAFILILFVAMYNLTNGQIITKQGEKIEYTIALETQIDNKIEFDLSIDNPTLFYIDSIKLGNIKLNILRNNYILHCSSDEIGVGGADLTLFGTALFGNDTVTYILFSRVKIDDIEIDLASIKIIVEHKYNHLYTRFSRITNIYPIPVNKKNELTLEYMIDVICDVNIFIINESGEILLKFEYYSQPKGTHKIFIDTRNYSVGVYYTFLKTKTGTSVYSFIIGS